MTEQASQPPSSEQVKNAFGELILQKLNEKKEQAIARVESARSRQAQRPVEQQPKGPCEPCITQLLEAAGKMRYKLLEFMLRAEAEAGHKPEIQTMIQRERRLLEDDARLANLCETVKNLLGKPPEG